MAGRGRESRPEGGDELVLVDQAVLQREQAEEQVAVGGNGGHGVVLPERRQAFGPRRRGPAAVVRWIGWIILEWHLLGRNVLADLQLAR